MKAVWTKLRPSSIPRLTNQILKRLEASCVSLMQPQNNIPQARRPESTLCEDAPPDGGVAREVGPSDILHTSNALGELSTIHN
jgi:hypothetical protein